VRDRAAARADAADLDHRGADFLSGDDPAVDHGGVPAAHQTHIGRGAAHIEGHKIAVAAVLAERGGKGDPRGRAREQRLVRIGGGKIDAHQAAIGLHDEQPVEIDAAAAGALAQLAEIGAHHRPDVGIERGGRQPRKFAYDRQYLA